MLESHLYFLYCELTVYVLCHFLLNFWPFLICSQELFTYEGNRMHCKYFLSVSLNL